MNASAVLTAGVELIVLALEGVAALLIASGGVVALVVFAGSRDPGRSRRAMSQMLLLALDFTIGADVLKGVSQPADLTTVEVVAVVAIIRIVLTFALQHELRSTRERAL